MGDSHGDGENSIYSKDVKEAAYLGRGDWMVMGGQVGEVKDGSRGSGELDDSAIYCSGTLQDIEEEEEESICNDPLPTSHVLCTFSKGAKLFRAVGDN